MLSKNSLGSEHFKDQSNVDTFLCTICHFVPHPDIAFELIQCGHIFCEECLNRLIKAGQACPNCKRTIGSSYRSLKIGNIVAYRILMGLAVKCPNQCSWSGALSYLDRHLANCVKVPVSNYGSLYPQSKGAVCTMNNSKSCSKCSAKCTEDSERVLKNMQSEHTFCAQCIKEFDNHSSPQCFVWQPRTITVQNSDPNKVAVRRPITVSGYFLIVYCFFLQLFSLGLIICFIVLFSDKDSGIYDYTALGICLLIDFILIFICMCILLYLGIIKYIENNKGDHDKTPDAVATLTIWILGIALFSGVVFCFWDIAVLVILAIKKNTFTTFTHIVLILSACYYGAFVLLYVGIAIAGCMGCFKEPLR